MGIRPGRGSDASDCETSISCQLCHCLPLFHPSLRLYYHPFPCLRDFSSSSFSQLTVSFISQVCWDFQLFSSFASLSSDFVFPQSGILYEFLFRRLLDYSLIVNSSPRAFCQTMAFLGVSFFSSISFLWISFGSIYFLYCLLLLISFLFFIDFSPHLPINFSSLFSSSSTDPVAAISLLHLLITTFIVPLFPYF